MKRAMTILMTAVLMLSMAGCGGGTGTDTTQDDTTAKTPKSQALTIGETAVTEEFEFTLTRFEFAERLIDNRDQYNRNNLSKQEYLLPGQPNESTRYFSEDGFVIASFSYTLNYLGKEPVNIQFSYGFNDNMKLDYNDGYIFENTKGSEFQRNENVIKVGNAWEGSIAKLSPLNPPYEGRGSIYVPLEVMENTDAPLTFVISICETEASDIGRYYLGFTKEDTPVFTYTLRAAGSGTDLRAEVDKINQELQGTWVSPDGKMTWVFDHGTLRYDQWRSDGKPNDTGALPYTIGENEITFRYPRASSDTSLSFTFENGVLTLLGTYSVADGGAQYEYVKQ